MRSVNKPPTRSIDAANHVARDFPTDEGVKLAKALIELGPGEWDGLAVDLAKLPASLVISPFFNALLQTIHDHEAGWLEAAKKITWSPKFDFQRENIQRWLDGFQPVTSKPPAEPAGAK